MQDPSAQAEGTPQKALGEMQVALGQGLADPRAAHPHTVQFDGGGRLDGEPLLATGVHQEGEVTGAVAAETEIVAHFKMPHRQSIDQDLADELGCRQLAQAAVEGQAEHHVGALPTQQLELLAQAGQTHRRRIGEKNSRGCGSKITTQLGTPSSSERSRRRARIAWCPRWTPSKLPMVATQPRPGAAGCVVREAAA